MAEGQITYEGMVFAEPESAGRQGRVKVASAARLPDAAALSLAVSPILSPRFYSAVASPLDSTPQLAA